MSRAGAPLRFLGAVLGGWIVVRGVLLWPDQGPRAFIPPLPPIARAAFDTGLAGAAPALHATSAAVASLARLPRAAVARRQEQRTPAPQTSPNAIAARPTSRTIGAERDEIALSAFYHYGEPPLPAPLPAVSRFSASLWGIVRGGRGGDPFTSPQLGGSQAGVRLAYALDRARRIAATVRVAGALEGAGREAAVGVEYRMAGAPVRIFAEQRVSLDGGRGGATLGAIAGVGAALPACFELQAYAQGGVIARDGGEGFVDGAVAIRRPLAAIGAATLDVGAGAWGAAQRGAARLDAGPSIGLSAPVAGQRVRLSLDWRQRLAGAASPASGPALSIGADF